MELNFDFQEVEVRNEEEKINLQIFSHFHVLIFPNDAGEVGVGVFLWGAS